MKKLLFIILSALLLSQNVQAQVPAQCTCNPNGFNPFVVTLSGVTTTVRCGHQFSLTCNDTIKINGGYKCVGDCAVKFVAVLKNSSGVVIQNFAPFNFPWLYKFLAAGNYSLEITPICGTTKCPPCRFFFTVTCPPPATACDCNPSGWQPFIATIGTTPPMTVNCGHQFGVHKQVPFKLTGKYICRGNCVAKYAAVLKNNVTGAIIQNYPVFTFSWLYTFTLAGNYKLEIIPICGDKRCQPCVFYLTVN
jgi:hypothetical protein